MIFKVQVSLATAHPTPRVLVYNEDRTIEWEGGLSDRVSELMRGRFKVFFEGGINHKDQIELFHEVPMEKW